MEESASAGTSALAAIYDDDIVKKFLIATVIWGVVGMLVGVIIALQLARWGQFDDLYDPPERMLHD